MAPLPKKSPVSHAPTKKRTPAIVETQPVDVDSQVPMEESPIHDPHRDDDDDATPEFEDLVGRSGSSASTAGRRRP